MIIAVHYVSANKQITIHRIFSQCLTVNLCVGCSDRVQRLPLSLKYWQTYLPQYNVKNEDKSPLTSVYNADAQICLSEYMNISMQIRSVSNINFTFMAHTFNLCIHLME